MNRWLLAARPGLAMRAGLAGLAVLVAGTVIAGSARPAAAGDWRGRVISVFSLHNGEGAVPRGMTEYGAENAVTDGTVIGPSYSAGTLAAAASGRTAVQLRVPGQYVQFDLTRGADAIDVSYSLSPGRSGSLAVYVNGARIGRELPLTPRYSSRSDRGPWFDDARMLLGRQLAAGTRVRLQVEGGKGAYPCTIDLADFYQVAPPAAQPAHAVSVLADGADPTGRADSSAAFRSAIKTAVAEREPVWIPRGSFRISSALHVTRAVIEGAGDWYSQLDTNEFLDNPTAVAGPIHLSGFAIAGSASGGTDDGSGAAISGSLGARSTVTGLWVQDTYAGLQLVSANTGLTVAGCEIFSTAAGGVMLTGDVSGSWLNDNFIRNTGADGLAVQQYPAAASGVTISNNTVVQPRLGNGIADYGGTGAAIIDNVVADTQAVGSGIAVANQMVRPSGFAQLAGTITVEDNTVLRSGTMDPGAARRAPFGLTRTTTPSAMPSST